MSVKPSVTKSLKDVRRAMDAVENAWYALAYAEKQLQGKAKKPPKLRQVSPDRQMPS